MASASSPDNHPKSNLFGKVGSDQSPIDRTFYDILNVSPTASAAEIKRSYYSLSLQYHPDRTQGLDEATRREYAEKFKTISHAYTILSDPEKRIRYNKYGRDDAVLNNGGAGFTLESFDAEEFFHFMFGGEEFQSIIGDFELAKTFKSAISEMIDNDERTLSDAERLALRRSEMEERQRNREQRINTLSRNLVEKLNHFTANCFGEKGDPEFQQATELFLSQIESETQTLLHAPYGENLLHSIGYVYSSKARLWSSKMDTEESSWKKRVVGHTKHFQTSCQERAHVVRETYRTFKSAIRWGQSVSRLAKATEDENENEPTEFHPNAARLEYSKSTPEENSPKVKINRKSVTQQRAAPLTEEEKRQLEGDMAAKSMEALWHAVKLEIESVSRDVCDRVLSDSNCDRRILRLRCFALSRIGEIWQRARST